MKCQNCGKSEVNFHYSSNINGHSTETHLCSSCASMLGYDFGRIFNENAFEARNTFGNFFPVFGGQPGYSPISVPVIGFGAPMTLRVQPLIAGNTLTGNAFAGDPIGGNRNNSEESGCGCGKPEANAQFCEVDNDMKARRELRMQMYIAAKNEDYEKAAELRDKLKEMEK